MSREVAPQPPVPGPLAITDVLDGMFVLYRASSRAIVALTLAVLVPLQLVVAFSRRGTMLGTGFGNLVDDPALASALLEGGGGLARILLGVVLVEGVVGPLLAGAYIAMAVQAQAGAPGDRRVAWAAVRRHGPALVGVWWLHIAAYAVPVAPAALVLARGGSVVWGVLLVPLAVFGALALMPLMALAAPAVVVEGLGPVAALRRSARLVRRRFFPVLGALLLTTFVIGVISLLIAAVPEALGAVSGVGYAWVLLAVGATISELVAGPLVAHAALLILTDVRARTEGHDLVVRARRRRPATPAGAAAHGGAG